MIGLAEAQWLRVRDQPAESNDRLSTAHNLAISLYEQGAYEEAAQMQRELLEVRRRVLGAEHPDTLHTNGNLAIVFFLGFGEPTRHTTALSGCRP